jgi:ATP-binding cassette subfamily C (CFTR/MRP) protein 4
MLGEALGGVATIRANNAVNYFRQKFEDVHNRHTRAFFSFIASSRWVGFRMDSIMFLFISCAVFLAVIFNTQNLLSVDPAILGLALTMLLQLSGLFQWAVRQSAEVVNLMVSVERVSEYGDLPPEAALTGPKDDPSWPKQGSIEVKDLSVRYRSTLPLSLKNVSFEIEAGQRIGIVGRTGSGKSTLIQALFRLLEAEDGCVFIDGVDIATLGLHKLRTSMSVIPQTPTLFSGCSIRENLDPFNQYCDSDIRSALLDASMLGVVEDQADGLDSIVAEGGSNFSVGQRQLLCLARAILRKSPILVLDEATANVDSRTDALLQEAVKKSFDGATIIAVAHRLDTVIEYDKILVLGGGEVVAFDSPHKLSLEENGVFASMIEDTGKGMASELRRRASRASLVDFANGEKS